VRIAFAALLVAPACGPASASQPVCAELAPEAAPLEASFATDPRLDARAAVFVQAAKDVSWATAAAEQEIAGSCQRIGRDLGLPPNELQPQQGPGGAAIGACDPVNARMDAILATGIRLWVTIGPPECPPNAAAFARCSTRCDGRSDPYCAVACKAHAAAQASCTETAVAVRVMGGSGAEPLVATLEANLPSLVQARFMLETVLSPEVSALLQAAAQLPGTLEGETHAKECAGASADLLVDASKRTRLAVRGSGDIVARVQGE
jgi:hypothetical protein